MYLSLVHTPVYTAHTEGSVQMGKASMSCYVKGKGGKEDSLFSSNSYIL